MTEFPMIRLSGEAKSPMAAALLDEVCSHFVEHAEVRREGDRVSLLSPIGTAEIVLAGERLTLQLECPSAEALAMSRTIIAEHLFYFAGDTPLDLQWAEAPLPTALPNLYKAVLQQAMMVTPHMRRLVFACADVTPFIGGDMHVRLLVPPAGRVPVWPSSRADGRIHWPEGEDAMLSRAYTIRSVDRDSNTVAIDFFQHPEPGVLTPGADFARDAMPGVEVGLLGPGSGRLPVAQSIFLTGDESALPAIARIVEELPAGTEITALVEVWDADEEQALVAQGDLNLRYVHRRDYADGTSFGGLVEAALAEVPKDSFIWAACEKADLRAIRKVVRREGTRTGGTYLAWYWSRGAADASDAD